MASFQPRTTKTPYIQSGTCATLDTMLRFASTYAASASRLKRESRESSFVGERSTNAVEGSNGVGSESTSKDDSGVGSVGRREEVVGETVANRGRRARVCITRLSLFYNWCLCDFQTATVWSAGVRTPLLTSSLAFLKADSRSSSGFHTLGTPASSYRNLSSKFARSVARTTASDVCSSSFLRRESHVRARRVAMADEFSSAVQL